MVTLSKLKFIKDNLVRAKIPTGKHGSQPQYNTTRTCQYCTGISQRTYITRPGAPNSFYMIIHGYFQCSNLIYCLECNICHIKYVGQTKNGIPDRFQIYFCDNRSHKYMTVARYFASHQEVYNPQFTVHFLNTSVSKGIPGSKSLRDKRELTWIHSLNTLIPNVTVVSYINKASYMNRKLLPNFQIFSLIRLSS